MTRDNVISLSEIDSLSKEIECIMCLNTANDPRMCIHCSAIVCVKCIESWINRKKSCPKCSHAVELTDFVKCRLANKMIDFIEGSKLNNCSDQSHETPRVYCSTCKQYICFECILVNKEHINHDYKYIDEDYQQICTLNSKLLEFLRTRCKHNQDKINSIESNIQMLFNNHSETIKHVNTDQNTAELLMEETQRLFDDYQKKKLIYNDERISDELLINDIEQRLRESKSLSDQEEILRILQKHIPSKIDLNEDAL